MARVLARVTELVAPATSLFAGALCYPFRTSIPGVVLRAVLPDFLWACAFACALMALTKSRTLVLVGFLVAELLELAQLLPAVPGTFDVLDVVAIALGFGCGLLLEAIVGKRSARYGVSLP